MLNNNISKSFFFLILFTTANMHCQDFFNQKKIDSLSNLDYKRLIELIDIRDTLNAVVYIKSYLRKGEKEKSPIKQAIAYKNLVFFDKGENMLTYSDSIISLTKNIKHKLFPSSGYFFKGLYLYRNQKYVDALDNFLKARETSIEESPDIEKYIGIIKTRLGYYEEALIAYNKALKSYKKDNYDIGILSAYYAISDVTRFLKQNDSSLYYCDLGYELAKRNKNDRYKSYFLFNKGATLSDLKKYEISQKFLFKALPVIIKEKDKANTAISHFFIGRNYKNLNNIKKAIFHLKKMDSIFIETNDLNPELRKGYEILINYYKKEKDLHNQLTYVNRMLLVDSIIYTNYHHLDKKLIKEYSRIKLKEEQKKINEKLNDLESDYSLLLKISIVLFFCFIGIILYKNFKHKKDKRKFELVINNIEAKENLKQIENVSRKQDFSLNDDVLQTLISKLDEFEKKVGFINPDINRNVLAKQFNTNPKYLSKVINEHKGKKYTDYINDLRVDYAIQKLKSNEENFMMYSVIAIANEVGYKYSEPFSRAFIKRTGLKPSFFIKELKKKTLNS